MTVLLAGCGELGTAVGLRLSAAGHRVTGLRRNPQGVPGQIAARAVDLVQTVPTIPPDTTIVVIALTADGRNEAAYRATYLTAVDNVTTALRHSQAPTPKVLMVSSTAVYGDRHGEWVDEHTEARPGSGTAEVLLETEQLLRSRLPQAIVLRLAGLYGPGHTRLIEQVREGRASIPPHLTYTNRIHRADAADAIVHLATMAGTAEPCYLGVDHAPVQRAEVLRFLADQLGVAHPPVVATDTRGGNKRCRNDRLCGTGFRFTYPSYRQGYRAILEG